MTLDDFLKDISSSEELVKSAGCNTEDKKTDSKEEVLSQAFKKVQEKLASAKPEETEEEASPLTDLSKIASEIGDLDYKTLIKEANLYGAGVADGFVGRLNEYNAIDFTKVASENDVPDHVIQKIASDAVEGFLAAQAEAKQIPAELDGYVKTASEIQKVASDIYLLGREQCADALGLEKPLGCLL